MLREVFLTNNRLCGSLEPLRGCTALQDVVLDSNQLTGGLQPLQSCTALQALYCRCCAPALRPNFARGGSIGSAPVAVYRIGSAVPRACVQVQPAVGRARAAAGVRGAREALPHAEHADGRPRAAPGLPRIAGALPGGQRVSTYEDIVHACLLACLPTYLLTCSPLDGRLTGGLEALQLCPELRMLHGE